MVRLLFWLVLIHWAKYAKPRGYLVAWIQHYFRPKAHAAQVARGVADVQDRIDGHRRREQERRGTRLAGSHGGAAAEASGGGGSGCGSPGCGVRWLPQAKRGGGESSPRFTASLFA